MDQWSKYSERGLWGVWREFFTKPWGVSIEYSQNRHCVDANRMQAVALAELPGQEVFTWQAATGFSLSLYADMSPSPDAAEVWRLLLHYESVRIDKRPTFFPFLPSHTPNGNRLNQIVAGADKILLFTGQPGCGKRSLLQSLSLLHIGRLPELEPQSLNHWRDSYGELWIVPEVAMLEQQEQKEILKSVGQGARLWAATAYDLGVLCSRKILSPPFARMLEVGRVHLPPVSAQAPEDVRALVEFWSAFYGVAKPKPQMNLDFLKQQTVAGAGLSVGSILEEGRGLRGIIAEFEKEAIRQAHARVGRSQHKIARLLKISRGSLQHKLRKYGLESYAPIHADTQKEE